MKGKVVQNGGMNKRSERAPIAETSLPGENVFRLRTSLGGENLNGERHSIRGSVFGVATEPTPVMQFRAENGYEKTEESPHNQFNPGKHGTRIPERISMNDPGADHRAFKRQIGCVK
jgi:hypothetical protein